MRRRGCLFFLILLSGCALVEPPQRSRDARERREAPEIRDPGGVHHTVRRGESLWLIGRAYGVEVEQIAVLNGIDNPDRLQAGKRLFIPGAKGARRVPAAKVPRQPPKRRPRWAAPPRRKTPPPRRVAASPKARAKSPGGERRARAKEGRRAAVKGAPRFSWPLRGRVVRRFRARGGQRANGILIAARERDKVRAAAPGRVIFSDFGPGNLGRLIILRHRGGEYHSIYAHVAKNLVRKGQRVSRGAPIALAGRTRRFKRARLHFEIRHRTRPQNPLSYLP